MLVSCHLRKKSCQRRPMRFELTVSKKMDHCLGQVDLTTRPRNWCTMRMEHIYLNRISKDGGIFCQLISSKVLNNSVRFVPHFLENKQINSHKPLLCVF